MKKGLVAIFLIVLSTAVVFLFIQNRQLKNKLDEALFEKKEAPVIPAAPETKPANPHGASPFDKPNVDATANRFPTDSPGVAALTTIKFDYETYDFGRITEGKKVKTKFRFTNTGKVGLLITHAQASCGCTVPVWPQDPIKPGETGEIEVHFDSRAKHGETEKTIIVDANTRPQLTTLTIKATVTPKEQ